MKYYTGQAVLTIENGVLISCQTNGEKHLVVPEDAQRIQEPAFKQNQDLQKISVPKTVTGIDRDTFLSCSNLQHLNLPWGVTMSAGYFRVGHNCRLNIEFYDINDSEVVFRNDVPEFLNDLMLQGMALFRNFHVRENGTSFVSAGFFEEDTRFESPTVKISQILGDVSMIPKKIFNRASNLVEMVVPNTIRTIEACAFRGTVALKTMNFPPSLMSIGSEAFMLSGLEEIDFSNVDDNLDIGEKAFSESKLKKVTFPKVVTRVRDFAFKDCKDLENVILPDNGSWHFDSAVFHGSVNLKRISAPKGTEIDKYKLSIVESCEIVIRK